MTIEEIKLFINMSLSRFQGDWAWESGGKLWSYQLKEYYTPCFNLSYSEYHIELWCGDIVDVCIQRTTLVIHNESQKLEAWQYFLSDLLKGGVDKYYRDIVQMHRSNEPYSTGTNYGDNSLHPKEKL